MQQEANRYFWHQDDELIFDVYQLFQYYNAVFFQGHLDNCTVRWTKRMTLCAGTCKYQGFGSSTISLSQPLLKFRTANELKETLIHEMIHAYLFKTNPAACQTEGGHGPAFVALMNKINQISGLNVSIYHRFHDEVDFYKKHVWRCSGRCRQQAPYYGYVKRSMNRPPQPADHWFARHRRECGGQFIKVSQPETETGNSRQVLKKQQKKAKKISSSKDKDRQWGYGKSILDYLKQMESEQRKKQAGEKIEKLRQESSTSIKDNEDRKKGQKEESGGQIETNDGITLRPGSMAGD